MSFVAKTRTFIDEVIVETKKITWPSREDLKESTTVVVISVIILSVILGVVDLLLSTLLKELLKIA